MFISFSRRPGFTLIELLIVVAIIAILAAIAVPNFLEAQTRAKISRNKADMRTEATALETYRIDQNKYPPSWEFNPTGAGRVWGTFTEIPGGPFHSRIPSLLTTPVSYLNSVPEDPFRKVKSAGNLKEVSLRHIYFNLPYHMVDYPTASNFVTAKKLGGEWLFYSIGPDGDEVNRPGGTGAPLVSQRVYRDYDATNGTTSLGNIFRTQKNGELLGYDSIWWTTP